MIMSRKKVTIKVLRYKRDNIGLLDLNDWKYIEVEAYRMHVPEFPNQFFYYHHSLKGIKVNPDWTLTEYRTGLMVSTAPVVEKLPVMLLGRCVSKGISDPAMFEVLVKDRIRQFGLANESPAP